MDETTTAPTASPAKVPTGGLRIEAACRFLGPAWSYHRLYSLGRSRRISIWRDAQGHLRVDFVDIIRLKKQLDADAQAEEQLRQAMNSTDQPAS